MSAYQKMFTEKKEKNIFQPKDCNIWLENKSASRLFMKPLTKKFKECLKLIVWDLTKMSYSVVYSYLIKI